MTYPGGRYRAGRYTRYAIRGWVGGPGTSRNDQLADRDRAGRTGGSGNGRYWGGGCFTRQEQRRVYALRSVQSVRGMREKGRGETRANREGYRERSLLAAGTEFPPLGEDPPPLAVGVTAISRLIASGRAI